MPDELTKLMSSSAAEVHREVHLPAAARIRSRAQRGRLQTAVTAGLSASVLMAGVGIMLKTGVDNAASLGDKDPSGLVMPHEGEPGWQRSNDLSAPAAFSGCGTSDPTLAGRTAAITMTGKGSPIEEEHSPTVLTEQLFFYDSQQTAAAVVAALSKAVTDCGWIDPHMGTELSGTRLSAGKVERVNGVQHQHAVFLVHSVTTGALMSSAGLNDLYGMGNHLCSGLGMCQPSQSPFASGSPGNPGSPGPQPTDTAWPHPTSSAWPHPTSSAWPNPSSSAWPHPTASGPSPIG